MNPIRHQQARCCTDNPMTEKPKNLPVAPALQSRIDQQGLPAPFNIIPSCWKGGGKHYLWPFYQLPKGPEVPSDCPWISLCYFITPILLLEPCKSFAAETVYSAHSQGHPGRLMAFLTSSSSIPGTVGFPQPLTPLALEPKLLFSLT